MILKKEFIKRSNQSSLSSHFRKLDGYVERREGRTSALTADECVCVFQKNITDITANNIWDIFL